jgi:AcrR family transcriptional regulator
MAPARRDHLLDVAGRVVRQGGWTALSMQGLAVSAGVSRQLVYEHFASVDDLYVAVLTHLFERAYEATAVIVRTGKTPAATVRAAYELFLDLPVEERRALRALASDVDPGQRRLTRATKRLRARIAEIWVPYVRLQTGLSEAEARTLAWMLITASWGLADTIADGTLDRRRALELFVRFVEHTLSAWRVSRAIAAKGTHRVLAKGERP